MSVYKKLCMMQGHLIVKSIRREAFQIEEVTGEAENIHVQRILETSEYCCVAAYSLSLN